ncbi:MAG TPA: DUF4190 domain-containing protein [Actinocrinis sp.]|nr:DUF4190 domain-containing protein [Actinocrinis sp.]
MAAPYQVAYPYLPGYGQPTGTNGLSIAAMVCGICGFIYGIPAILGIIFGFIGLAQTKRTGQNGRGMAIAGIICGLAWIALFIVLVIVLVVAAHDSNLNKPNGFND